MRATRDWFGESLAEIAARCDDVVVVNCDLGSATRTLKFRELFPDRFFECGIAEANAIGIAAGLAQEGYRPFVASFGHFLTGKYLEIFQTIGLNESGVVLVGTHAGLAVGRDGPTQMGLRDLALMRTLPNLEILQPADGQETRQMVEYLSAHWRPAYLRLCRQPLPEVHDAGYRFRPGAPDVVIAGKQVAVLTMGGMVPVVVDALAALPPGLTPTVVNISSLPVSRELVASICRQHDWVVVVEDHFIKGGIADEIARIAIEESTRARFVAWGVPDYGQSGAPEDLYRRYQLDAAGVAARITALLIRPA